MRSALRAGHPAVTVLAVLVLLLGWRADGMAQQRAAVPTRTYHSGNPALDKYLNIFCEDSIPPFMRDTFATTLVSASLLDNRVVHDCQKLLKTPRAYGPLVAVLPADFDSVRARFDRAMSTWPLADRAARASTYQFVLADIVNYSTTQSYAPLDIRPLLNCLWISGDPRRDPTHWIAKIGRGLRCTKPTELVLSRDTLSVRVLPYTDKYHTQFATGRIPSSARWEWDRGTATQLIGVHCGSAWCEFGIRGLAGRNVQPGDGIGLRDEQFLAAYDSIFSPAAAGTAKPKTVHPSRVWARIEPYSVLASQDANVYHSRQKVAAITLDAPIRRTTEDQQVLDYYRRRYSLERTLPRTDIWMWYANSRYLVATALSGRAGTVTNRCPWTHGPTGGVRWRWDVKDEMLWLACTDGCCSTRDIQ